ncbi:MAG: chloramphenicol phosphotransferase CPT [Thermomicrobiales bacterium]
MSTQIIMLNGGSSSGKTGISRCLQSMLPHPWLRISIDDLVDSLPPALLESDVGISFGLQGEVSSGAGFRAIEAAWMAGIATMARAGARIILDDVFLGGAESQARVRGYLDGLEVLWVGVRCPAEIAAGREMTRGDRVVGMAASQAKSVHADVAYDVEVETSRSESIECARIIASRVV